MKRRLLPFAIPLLLAVLPAWAEGPAIRLHPDNPHYLICIHHSAPPGWKDKKSVRTGEFRTRLSLDIPAGRYEVKWVDPKTGKTLETKAVASSTGTIALETPTHAQDIALRVNARQRQVD